MEEQVILVNREDKELGTMGKMAAHEQGELHRAFSVFLFNDQGDTLLQQRAAGKYHSPGLWTNSCCSHPRQGETVEAAAQRRLGEELGIQLADISDLERHFHFVYRADFDNGLIEHELDHVLTAKFDGVLDLNEEEVQDVQWMSIEDIEADMASNPDDYTAWFKIIFDQYLKHIPR